MIDSQTGRMGALPDSFDYVYPGPNSTWMNNDRLFVVRHSRLDLKTLPLLEVWQVDLTSDTLLTETLSDTLYFNAASMLIAPRQLADGRLAFAAVNAGNAQYTERGLYFADSTNLAPHKANGLPPFGKGNDVDGGYSSNVKVFWSPDGSGAIVRDPDNQQILYVPTDGTSPYDLRPVLGEGACCCSWLGR